MTLFALIYMVYTNLIINKLNFFLILTISRLNCLLIFSVQFSIGLLFFLMDRGFFYVRDSRKVMLGLTVTSLLSSTSLSFIIKCIESWNSTIPCIYATTTLPSVTTTQRHQCFHQMSTKRSWAHSCQSSSRILARFLHWDS